MIDPKAQKQAKPKIVVAPKSSPAKVELMAGAVPLSDRIRERAYALYESRGREAGHDKQDWLCAEREILNAER